MPTDAAATALTALDLAHRELLTALWLSAGMVLGGGLIIVLALGWRRCALVAGLGYGVTLCFVPVGHARAIGPVTIAAAVLGLLQPRRRAAQTSAGKATRSTRS